MKITLTGKKRLRLHKRCFGSPLLVQQLEEHHVGRRTFFESGWVDSFPVDELIWRDARVEDLS